MKLPVTVFHFFQTDEAKPRMAVSATHVFKHIFVLNKNSAFWASANAWTMKAKTDYLCRTSSQDLDPIALCGLIFGLG